MLFKHVALLLALPLLNSHMQSVVTRTPPHTPTTQLQHFLFGICTLFTQFTEISDFQWRQT